MSKAGEIFYMQNVLENCQLVGARATGLVILKKTILEIRRVGWLLLLPRRGFSLLEPSWATESIMSIV